VDPKEPKDPHAYLSTWLERHKKASDVAPEVQKFYEYQEWKRHTLERRPTDASSISTSRIEESDSAFYERLKTNLPMLPTIDLGRMTEIGSSAAYSGTNVVMYLEEVSQLQTPATNKYVEDAFTEYRKLQDSHDRPEQIRTMLEQKLPSVTARFDTALGSHQRWRSSGVNETGAAVDMRTFLEGLEGQLREKARNHPGENMPPELILERLFPSASTRIEVKEQFNQRSDLVAALSTVAKQRDQEGTLKLDALWLRVLNHAFIVVGALN
jgi:hypothetical protein